MTTSLSLRRVPHGLHDGLKESLVQMEHDGTIAEVGQPTDWVDNRVIKEK